MSRPETLPQFNKAIIAADETRRGREIITSADWNNLFNQHRYQGNHSETYLEELDHYLFGVIQDGEELSHGVINTLIEDATSTANDLATHVANTNNPHSVTMAQIPDLQATLSTKADSFHLHSLSDIVTLQATLNNKANTNHTHTISNISNLQTTLNGKSNTGHTHAISDVTNLQTSLNGKVDKVSGKGLSTNDFTDVLKTKLESITPTGQLMANWGDISGTLSNQTDLMAALEDAKASGAVNLIPYPYGSSVASLIREQNGIIYTVNPEDGTVSAKGTASANAWFDIISLTKNFKIPAGNYNVSGCPSGGSASTYGIYVTHGESLASYGKDHGDGLNVTVTAQTADEQFRIVLGVLEGNTVDIVFKPMLIKGEAKPEIYNPPLGIKATRDYLAEAVPNLLPYPFYDGTRTLNGITYTLTGNATVRANGTCTGDAWFSLIHSSNPYHLKAGTYSICGCPTGGTNTKYWFSANKVSGNVEIARDYGSGATFTLTEDTDVLIGIMVKNGTTVSNIEFKPMLVPGDMIPKIFRAPEYMATFAKTKAYNNEQVISALADTVEGVETTLKNMLSKYWSSATTYKVGTYCWYNSKLWRCKIQHSNVTPSEGTYWTEIDVCSELSQLTPMTEAAYNALATKENRLYFLT